MDGPEGAEDGGFQRAMWVVERVGWGILAAVLAAAAAGLFGPGLLGPVEEAAADGAWRVEYPRFARAQSPFTLRVRVEPAAAAGERLRVWFSEGYFDRFSVAGVVPEPESVEVGGGRVTYAFARSGGGGAGVRLVLESAAGGRARGEIGVGDGPPVSVRQFFYP